MDVTVLVRPGPLHEARRHGRGLIPAAGIEVGVFQDRTVLGVAKIIARAVTDARGRVRFTARVKKGFPISLRLRTESALARVAPPPLLLKAHTRVLSYPAGEVSGKKLKRTLRFSNYDRDVFVRAMAVQDTAHRVGAFARRVFGDVLPRYNKVTYSFPGLLGTSSYAPFSNRVVIKDKPYHRDQEVVAHETFHTFWYLGRGKNFEYYLPLKHRLDERAGNPSLAASEGWASAMALFALRDASRSLGLPPPRDLGRGLVGETHPAAYGFGNIALATWRSWGEDGEANVLCAFVDLVDRDADRGAVDPRYTDRSNGGKVPSGAKALRALFATVKASRGRHPSLIGFWRQRLGKLYGRAGLETLLANGVDPRR
ncbi:MAG: hypothetical protein D6731_15755 [Planctomycetota bacterium]|nr:MAG: hypothetical protein D6731_15755 [Planctomycetota bacterium]